jgi:uncharacterized protein YndB with AHSA1/START domain
MTSAKIKPAPVRRTLTVKASPQKAFKVFTAGIGRWWPASHHTAAAAFKTATIEPFVGGRWYEAGQDGSESDWGKVLAWEPPARLVLAWQLNSDFRYDPDLITEVEVRFLAEGEDATRVEFEHRLLERFGERAVATRESIDSPGGWTAILEQFVAAANA